MRRPAAALALALAAPGAAAEDWTMRCLDSHDKERVLACREALKISPKDVALRRALGRGLLDIGDGPGGAAAYGGIAEDRPNDAFAWYEFALALATDYRFEDAAAAIERSLRLDPDSVHANKIAVIAFESTRRFGAAFQASLRLAEMGDATGMFDVGTQLIHGRRVAGDLAVGIAWLERAAEAGHVAAMERLSGLYADGAPGLAPDKARAEAWQQRARKATQ